MKYRGMIIEKHADGYCWHDGTPDGEYGGYWETETEARDDIDWFLENGRGY